MSLKPPRKFWLVWNGEDSTPARKCHDSRQGAIDEATRLATANRGREFFVIEAVSMVRTVDVEVLELAEELPF